MTKRQQQILHAALSVTETEWHPDSGLPVCTDVQIMQRKAIISQFNRTGTVPSTESK